NSAAPSGLDIAGVLQPGAHAAWLTTLAPTGLNTRLNSTVDSLIQTASSLILWSRPEAISSSFESLESSGGHHETCPVGRAAHRSGPCRRRPLADAGLALQALANGQQRALVRRPAGKRYFPAGKLLAQGCDRFR